MNETSKTIEPTVGVQPQVMPPGHVEHLRELLLRLRRVSDDMAWIEGNWTNLTGECDQYGDEKEDALTEVWPYIDSNLDLDIGLGDAIRAIEHFLIALDLAEEEAA